MNGHHDYEVLRFRENAPNHHRAHGGLHAFPLDELVLRDDNARKNNYPIEKILNIHRQLLIPNLQLCLKLPLIII